MTTTEPHPAISHRCPFCHADPGQQCHARGSGAAKNWPHSQRLALVDTWHRRHREHTTEQALCCECGNARTFKKARNQVAERCDSQTWHRMTGDLKCDVCGRTTRHALLRSGEYRDTAENYQRMALGGQPTDRLEDVDRARREYRQGLPRNPYLQHRYWVAEARKAWGDGTKRVTGLCGEPMDLNHDPDGSARSSSDPNALVEPSEVRADQEYEDPDTGLWWMEMDCVDCLRIANNLRLNRQLNENLERIRKLLGGLTEEDLTLEDTRDLRDVLERIASERGCEIG